jgi:hypothetical protein
MAAGSKLHDPQGFKLTDNALKHPLADVLYQQLQAAALWK